MTDPSKPADPSARPVRRPRGLCPVCRQERHLRAGGTLGQHNRLTRQGYNIGVCSGVDLPALTEGPEPMPDPITPTTTTVYVSIGNSDDKLTQREWADFVRDFRRAMRHHATQIYGEWYAAPDVAYQNACIAAAVYVGNVDVLRGELTEMRQHYDQDSVAWAAVPTTDFI